MNAVDVRIYRNDGIIPTYETEHAAGCDIYSIESLTVEPGARALVRTGIHVEIPHGFELQIRPRSGHALKKGITVLNTPGTIDSDYRGEVKIIIANFGTEAFPIEKSMRIAQGVISPVYKANFIDVKNLENLSETNRGAGGFGHTGH